MTQRVRFTQADVTRAVKGVLAAGLTPERIEIGPDGAIIIQLDEEADPPEKPLSAYINRTPYRQRSNRKNEWTDDDV